LALALRRLPENHQSSNPSIANLQSPIPSISNLQSPIFIVD